MFISVDLPLPLTHDCEILVAADLQRHAAERVDDFFAHHVVFCDVLDVDDKRAGKPAWSDEWHVMSDELSACGEFSPEHIRHTAKF